MTNFNKLENIEKSFMQLALNLAKRNIGITAPNPCVGCVLVKNNTIIATGITGKNGVPHAENIAISKAGEKAKNATLFVTLEPCCHFGKTDPCVDLIIKSQISKVVIATSDSDLRVNGSGIEKLKKAGIEVKIGVLEEEAKKLNCGFFHVKKLNRPFITLKLATSLDGKIAAKNGDSKWITSEKSRKYAHYLRAKNDAILIGANTVRKDNPMLDCRILGLEEYCPKRIILSSKLDIDLNSKIIQSAKKVPTYIFTNNCNYQKFADLGVNVIYLENKNQQISLKNLMPKLGEIGVNNLLIEGGGVVNTQFLQEDLIDKIIWIKAAKIIGNDGISAIGDLNFSKISQSLQFKINDFWQSDGDLIIKFLVNDSQLY